MVRISEIHADGRAAKTYLAAPGRPDLDLLPHEVVRCAFLVDYRRHSHDACLLLQPFLLRSSQLSRANSLADAELSSIDMLRASAIGLRMVAAANLVEVAALVGDTARATMLNALMGGQSLTATELAYCANVSRSTASGHLSKLVAARLLTVIRDRRFSYYRIASPLVATMLESMKVVAGLDVALRRPARLANDDALRFARSCYDHLAGQAGVAVTDALVAMGHVLLTDEGGEVTASGTLFLSAFGVDLTPRTRRIFCQPCLDWSERRYHLKGLVGARILDRLLELGWLKSASDSRALQLPSSGRAGLYEIFQIEINNGGANRLHMRPTTADNLG